MMIINPKYAYENNKLHFWMNGKNVDGMETIVQITKNIHADLYRIYSLLLAQTIMNDIIGE